MNIKRFILPLLLSLSLSACVRQVHHYSGPIRAESESASLQIAPGLVEVTHFSVDGHKVDPASQVWLLPGKHQVTLEFRTRSEDAESTHDILGPKIGTLRKSRCSVQFDTKGGQTLFLYPRAATHALLTGSHAEQLTVRESGFEMPDLFSGRCQSLGTGTSVSF